MEVAGWCPRDKNLGHGIGAVKLEPISIHLHLHLLLSFPPFGVFQSERSSPFTSLMTQSHLALLFQKKRKKKIAKRYEGIKQGELDVLPLDTLLDKKMPSSERMGDCVPP